MKQNYSLSQSADFMAAVARGKELQGELAAAQESEESMQLELGNRGLNPQSELMVEAEARLGGAKLSEDTRLDKLRERHAEIRREITILTQTCKMQSDRVELARQLASAEICKKAQGEHRELVRKIAAGIKDLANATTAEQEFRDALESSGVSTGHLRQPHAPVLGHLKDRGSLAWTYLYEMYKSGLIDREDVPGLED